MTNFPFFQIKINNILIRKFNLDVETSELIWHIDSKDRIIYVVSAGKWSVQIDNQLPFKLSDGDIIFIKKNEWHRIIKDIDNLIIAIEETE